MLVAIVVALIVLVVAALAVAAVFMLRARRGDSQVNHVDSGLVNSIDTVGVKSSMNDATGPRATHVQTSHGSSGKRLWAAWWDLRR